MVERVIPQPIWFWKNLCDNLTKMNILVYMKQWMEYANDIGNIEIHNV